jgi:hypothetical protein
LPERIDADPCGGSSNVRHCPAQLGTFEVEPDGIRGDDCVELP